MMDTRPRMYLLEIKDLLEDRWCTVYTGDDEERARAIGRALVEAGVPAEQLRRSVGTVLRDTSDPSLGWDAPAAQAEADAAREEGRPPEFRPEFLRRRFSSMTLEELRVFLAVARRNGRRPSRIRVGAAIQPEWVREMAPHEAYAGTALVGQPTVFGIPFDVDPDLPARAVELEGL